MVLLLISCQNQEVTMIENHGTEAEEIIEENLGLWYQGYIGEEPFKIQWHEVETMMIGKLLYDNQEYIITGQGFEGFFDFTSDLGSIKFYQDDQAIFGMMTIQDEVFKVQATIDTLNHKFLSLSEDQLALQGHYYHETSDYYEGSYLEIKPLFDHVISVTLHSYDGLKEEKMSWLAYEKEDFISYINHQKVSLTKENFDWYLHFDDLTLNRKYTIEDKPVFTENVQLQPRDLLEIWPEDLLVLMKNLLSEEYDKLQASAQNVNKESFVQLGVTGDPNSVLTYFSEGQLYVYLSGRFYDNGLSRLYTNNLNELPVEVLRWSSDQVIRKALIKSNDDLPFKVDNISDLSQEMTMMYQAKGFLDKDSFEDVILWLNKGDNNFLAIYMGHTEGFTLKYVNENILDDNHNLSDLSIENNQLILNYILSESNQSEKYIFEAKDDFPLVQVIFSQHASASFDVLIEDYDLINDLVTVTENNNTQTYYKILHDTINVQTFNVKKGIHEDYR